MTIPRILHQTWKTDRIPDQWVAFAGSWRRLHPGWDYRLWTDAANRGFVAEHYPELLATYDGYAYDIQRADAVRYCLLHHFGGVYADLDIECLEPVDELVDQAGFLAVLEPDEQCAWLGRTSLVSNAFMAARPGHPFLQAVIEALIAKPSPGLTHLDVLETTGPLMLDDVRRDYGGNDLTILPSHVVFPFPSATAELARLRAGGNEAEALKTALKSRGTVAVHYWDNSWVDALAGELVNPEPHAVEGFRFYPGLDSPGHDIANVGRDVPSAAAVCLQMETAVAFNTDGFVKDRLLPSRDWLPVRGDPAIAGLYVRLPEPRSGVMASLGSLLRRLLGRGPV